MVDCFIVGKCEAGQAVFAIEYGESVMVDYVAWRCGQTKLNGVEIVEDFAVSIIDGAVAFIDNKDVEKMRRKGVCHVAHDVQHRRICSDIDTAVCSYRLLAWLRPTRLVGNMLLKRVESLTAKSNIAHSH